MASPIPEKILRLARAVREEGGRALMVGGCVRDRLMGRAVKDWDVEVYGVEPARLRALLDRMGRVNVVGEAFTVYKLGYNLDVSLPRRERKTGRGHRGFVIEGDPWMPVEEAARRRDFTVNAILEDPLDALVLDPFGGRADIERRLLRAVAPDTFVEDSLRVLRAAQFAARFEFEVEPETIRLCHSIDLTDLPAERLWGEVEKILLVAERPSLGLEWLGRLGATAPLFPELAALEGVPQDPVWHPEGDVAVHTRLVCDRARELIADLDAARRVTVMMAALCHDFGKPATTAFVDGRVRSRGHEEAGVAPTLAFLDRLKIFTLDGYDVRAQTAALVRDHLKPGEFYRRRAEVGPGAFRRLARRCELELLYLVARADTLGRNAPWVPRERHYDAAPEEWFIEQARALAVERAAPAALLMGRHLLALGLTPSPLFREVLDSVYEMQLDDRVRTLEEAEAAARSLLAARGVATRAPRTPDASGDHS